MQFLQDGTEFCQLIYADYLDDNGSMLADDTRLDATDPQINESDWCYESIGGGAVGGSIIGVGGIIGIGVGGNVGGGGSVGGSSVVGGGYGGGHRVGGMDR